MHHNSNRLTFEICSNFSVHEGVELQFEKKRKKIMKSVWLKSLKIGMDKKNWLVCYDQIYTPTKETSDFRFQTAYEEKRKHRLQNKWKEGIACTVNGLTGSQLPNHNQRRSCNSYPAEECQGDRKLVFFAFPYEITAFQVIKIQYCYPTWSRSCCECQCRCNLHIVHQT